LTRPQVGEFEVAIRVLGSGEGQVANVERFHAFKYLECLLVENRAPIRNQMGNRSRGGPSVTAASACEGPGQSEDGQVEINPATSRGC
jgi:hypothetical protein